MKSFQQFNEDIAKELEGLAQSFSLSKDDQRKLAGKITGEVLNKLINPNLEKLNTKIDSDKFKEGLPKAINKANEFINSGKIENDFQKLKDILSSSSNIKKEIKKEKPISKSTPTETPVKNPDVIQTSGGMT